MSPSLAGLRLLVTRDPASAIEWIAALESHGVVAEGRAVLAFEPVAGPESVAAALATLTAQDWVVFASANGARFFAEACGDEAVRLPPGVRVAAIGSATAVAARGVGWRVDFVSPRSDGSGFGEALAVRIGSEGRALVVRPESGRPELAAALRGAGVDVAERVVYRTVPDPDLGGVAADIRGGRYDAILFTAPSTFAFLVACESTVPGLRRCLGELIRVAIGPTTGEALARAGMAPTAVAARPDAKAIVAAVADAAAV